MNKFECILALVGCFFGCRRASDPAIEQAAAAELVAEGEALERPAIAAGHPRGKFATDARTAAIKKYSEAIAECPRCPSAYAARSSALYFLGNVKAARADAKTAIALGFADAKRYTILAAPFRGEEQREVLRKGMSLTKEGEFEYYFLWNDLAESYFHERNFAAHVGTVESIVASMSSRLDEGRPTPAYQTTLFSLGMGLEALGDYAAAEAAYRKVYQTAGSSPADSANSMRGWAANSMVLARMRSGDYAGAEALLTEHAGTVPDGELLGARVVLAFLLNRAPTDAAKLRAMIQPTDGYTYYDTFAAAVGLLHAGFSADAAPHLRRYISDCEGNPAEWGVTMRWEIAKAKELVAKIDADSVPR